jgi:hypothetical protein
VRIRRHFLSCSATRPLVAAAAACAVFLLAILGVSPDAHAWIHGDHHHDHRAPTTPDHDEAGHRCAVTLAQQGFCDTTPLLRLLENPAGFIERAVVAAADHAIKEPDHRLPQAQAPPQRA